MASHFDELRVRLIQVREEPEIEQEEQESFRESAGLRPDQLLSTNVLRDPVGPHLLEGIDAVLIGGAGAFSVTRDYPWMPPLIDLLHQIYTHHIPLFGSCWGHQLIGRAYGGKVIYDPEKTEIGCFEVYLTEAGKTDPLLKHMPPAFLTLMGHQDRIAALPREAIELGYSANAPYQIIRMKDRPIYGTQFHSELNAACERERITTYREHYPHLLDDKRFLATLEAIEDTPLVRDLIHRFLNLYAVHPPVDGHA